MPPRQGRLACRAERVTCPLGSKGDVNESLLLGWDGQNNHRLGTQHRLVDWIELA